MNNDIVACDTRNPYVGIDEHAFAEEEFRTKRRWAGVLLESYPKFMEVYRLRHIDLTTGWGADADDPDSLSSFEDAVHARRTGKVHYFVYLPEAGDDTAKVNEMNRILCPVDLQPQNQPTYKELLAEDPMHKDFTNKGSVEEQDLVPHLTQVAMLHYFCENSIVGLDTKTILEMLNDTQRSDRERISFDEGWLRMALGKAFAEQEHIMVYSLLGDSFRVSQKKTPPPRMLAGGPRSNVWYQIERL